MTIETKRITILLLTQVILVTGNYNGTKNTKSQNKIVMTVITTIIAMITIPVILKTATVTIVLVVVLNLTSLALDVRQGLVDAILALRVPTWRVMGTY